MGVVWNEAAQAWKAKGISMSASTKEEAFQIWAKGRGLYASRRDGEFVDSAAKFAFEACKFAFEAWEAGWNARETNLNPLPFPLR